ncbi:MAG: radical SAM protein [Nitrospiraceae bacterium]
MVKTLAGLARPVLNLVQQRPILAVFEVCLRCNSACGYCDLPLNVGRYEMSRAEIRRVFTDLYEDGLRFIFVQGGEPLLRRDLPDILEDLASMGYSLTLVTNGTRFTPGLVARLAELPLNISVSLDTLDRTRYARIRGADQLPQVLAGIELLDDFPHPKYLTCIVSRLNQDDVLDVVRFAQERGFTPVVGAYHWEVERYGKVDVALQYDRKAVAQVFQQVMESGLIPRGYFRNYLRDNVNWLYGQSLERCDAGRYSIAIDASGNVAPCLALAHAGNLLKQPLQTILTHFDRASIDRCSDRSSCNMLCSRVVGSVLRHPISAWENRA